MAPSTVRPSTSSTHGAAVLFTLAVLVLAVGTAYLRGGRLHRLAHARLRWTWLLFVGVGLQVVVDLAAARGALAGASTSGWLGLFVSQVLVLVWVLRNRHLAGMWLIALGLALNAVVIAANGAMPVSVEAIESVGGQLEGEPTGKHTPMTDDTRLPWLGDVIPIPPIRSIISVGDIVLAAGLIPLAHALMTDTPYERRRQRVWGD